MSSKTLRLKLGTFIPFPLEQGTVFFSSAADRMIRAEAASWKKALDLPGMPAGKKKTEFQFGIRLLDKT